MDINSAGFYESLQTQRDDGSSKKNVFLSKIIKNEGKTSKKKEKTSWLWKDFLEIVVKISFEYG